MAQPDESADLDMFDSEEAPAPTVRPFALRPDPTHPERGRGRDETADASVRLDDYGAGAAVIGRLHLAAPPRQRSSVVPVIAVSVIALVGGAGVLGAYLYDPALRLRWPLQSAAGPRETPAATDTGIDAAAVNAPRPRDAMPLVGTVVAGTAGPSAAPPASPAPAAARTAPAPVSRPAAVRPVTVAAPTSDVSGEWTLAMRVESSTLDYFEGMWLGYEVRLQQRGTIVTGTGMKVSENGVTIGTAARTSIDIWGTHEGNRLQLSFNQRGAWHPRSGTFGLLAEGDEVLQGRFATDPDPSTGTVEARRRN